ncbi:MAG: putative lipid II flippase FtsW [Proteobacteria bacterium]|nr:putative lipid II flippase FtsW [Pseudomonadota bacterium]
MNPKFLAEGKYCRNALLFTVLLLTSLGLLVIYTSSSIPAEIKFHDTMFFVRKQFFLALLGFMAISLLQLTSLRLIERLTLPLVTLAIFCLILTLIPGFQLKVNGASRWVRLGFFSFQPSELGKLALILFLARNLSRPSVRIDKKPLAILPNLGVLAGFAVLLMLQPDFGSTVVYASITMIMLFAAGLPFRYIVSAIGCGFIGVVAAIIHAPYRLARITSFLDPWESIRTGGFQIVQSYLGFHNGGLFGLGLGESRQKLFFLPEAHTDFILSVVGEEIGLIGVLLVLCCFAYIAWLGLRITTMQTETYRKFLAMGLSSLISIQAIVNMGVAMGLLPTKGMPLPFVSYGSSSLLSFLLMVGILARLAKTSSKAQTMQL